MAVIPGATISTNIAALSVTVIGLDQATSATQALAIRSLATMRADEEQRNGPLLQPAYPGFETVAPEIRLSMGHNNPFMQSNRTLNYWYLHSKVGSGRYSATWAADISLNCQAIADAIALVCGDLGPEQVLPGGFGDMQIITDQNGVRWYGANFAMAVIDYRNMP